MTPPKTKLYVGCSLANAPEDFKKSVEVLKDRLKESYEVLEFKGQVAGTNKEVYKWDIEHCVADCDIFLAVCDFPSIGLGWELNEAIGLDKPTLGVAHTEAVMSRLILGAAEIKRNFTLRRYNDLLVDVPVFIDELITANLIKHQK